MQTNASTATKKRRQKRISGWQWAGRGYSTGAMATAVSSGDDLTDFQSQPRSGQRFVSPAGGRGGRSSCSSVRVEFALWSLLLLGCAALPWPLCSRYLYLFLFYFYIYTVVHVCLSHCLTVCLSALSFSPFVSLTLCLFAASTFAGRSSEPTVTATSTRGVARGGRTGGAGRNIRNAFPCGVEINCE